MDLFLEWLQVLIPSILVVVSGLIGYVIKSRADEYLTIKEKINQEQREIYKKMINPYINVLAEAAERTETTTQPQLSPKELRKTLFELNLVGSDSVIRAYNRILQKAYRNEREGIQNPKEIALLFGELLLQIRKSLGHKKTKLKPREMLEGTIKDMDKFFN